VNQQAPELTGALRSSSVEGDHSTLDAARIPAALLRQARGVWQERVCTEYRSVQLMNHLLGDALAAGLPLEVQASIATLITDEMRHVELCAGIVRALGAKPLLPVPLELLQPQAFLDMPPELRVLATAVTMLIVNETLSVGYIEDLHARCKQPAIFRVLQATLADEAGHDAFGVNYVRQALQQQAPTARAQCRRLAEEALRPQRELAAAVVREMPAECRNLSAWPDEREVALGLFSDARQALVFEQTYRTRLAPCLSELRLL
jgi:hypothetical protein